MFCNVQLECKQKLYFSHESNLPKSFFKSYRSRKRTEIRTFLCVKLLLNINAYFKTKQLTMNLDFDEGFGLPRCSSSTFFEMRRQGAPLVVIRSSVWPATVFFSSTDKRLPPLHSQPYFRSVGQIIILKQFCQNRTGLLQ